MPAGRLGASASAQRAAHDMPKAVDAISVLLLAAAAAAFINGVYKLGSQRDLLAVYWLIVGALCLRAAVDLLRPKAGTK